MSNAETLPEFTTRFVNLADPRLGAKATFATDDFFAPKERMLDPNPPVFIPGKYDDNGKWMDGWESRRKRTVGHDWCVVRLGVPGRLHGVEIDTRHFTGNYPPAASLEAVWSPDGDPGDDAAWTEVLPAVPLQGDSRAFHALTPGAAFTHVRLHIWPDGGVARLRVYGAPAVDRDRLPGEIDLAAAQYGGRAVAWNDAHYGAPHNLLMPGRGVNMGDGWETRRRREPGNDWCILALGVPGTVRTVVIDTAHFKGNFPDRASIQGARVDGGTDRSLITQSMFWPELLPPQKLSMDTIHTFAAEVLDLGVITHVRLNVLPDGGVSRLRLIGRVDRGDG